MADDLTAGAVIAGRYRLERLLAEGGMGVVWAAKDLVTRRPVALKFVKGEAADDERTRRRLLREARAACAVQHPNVVTVHDVQELESGSPFLVMDLLKGESLRAKLDREGRIPLHDLANIMVSVVSAVGTAHASGVVHRDLKPENIFLAEMPGGAIQVKVLDFGIAKLTSAEGIMVQSGALTGTGLLLGTPDYMSLEQILGEEDVDHRADIWALGIVLYECLDGRRPTAADNVGKVLKIVLTNAIPPISQVIPTLPDELKALVSKMLTLDRTGRPANLLEVGRVLERYATIPLLPFDPPRARPLSEGPPEPMVSLPSAKPSPRPARGAGEHKRTLGPDDLPPAYRAAVSVSPQAKTTVPDKGGAYKREIELVETQAAPLQGPRPILASHPLIVPSTPIGGRGPIDSGMSIALDEPFATERGPNDQPITMGKSLTLGDLLSPEELVMLGERLERAQSDMPDAPGAASSAEMLVSPGIPVAAGVPNMMGMLGGAGAADSSPPPSSTGPPISSSEMMPVSEAGASLEVLPEEPPVSSDEIITLVAQKLGVPRYELGPGRPLSESEFDHVDLSDTMPVPLRIDGVLPPPTLPFVQPRSAGRPSPVPAPYKPPVAPHPHRLSFSDPGGSREYTPHRQSFSDASGIRPPLSADTSSSSLRSTEVQTPSSTTTSTPPWPHPAPSRRGKVWAVLGGLAFLAILGGWLLFSREPPPNPTDRPVDTATAPPSVSQAPPTLPSCPEGMALIPGGSFDMGSNDGRSDERPPHSVTITTFCMDLMEVTLAAYQSCVEDSKCEAPSRQVSAASTSKPPMDPSDRAFESGFCQDPRRPELKKMPMNCVNWNEATTFCLIQGKRLPTELEWEYTARGGKQGRLFPWGSAQPSAKYVNACDGECEKHYEKLKRKKSSLFSESDGYPTVSPVNSFPAGDSLYGTHDMAGNVWEWTASRYCKYASGACSETSRVFRGGGFATSSAQNLTGAARMSGSPENRYMDVGFRCAKDKG